MIYVKGQWLFYGTFFSFPFPFSPFPPGSTHQRSDGDQTEGRDRGPLEVFSTFDDGACRKNCWRFNKKLKDIPPPSASGWVVPPPPSLFFAERRKWRREMSGGFLLSGPIFFPSFFQKFGASRAKEEW